MQTLGVSKLKLKILAGWILITFSYFVTFYYGVRAFYRITSTPIDLMRYESGLFLGSFLISIPYILGGLYARMLSENPTREAFWISIVPAISEKLLIYLIGLWFYSSGGDGSIAGLTVMDFIQAEAAPYYTITYVIMSIVSVVITVFIARLRIACKFINYN